MVKSEAKFALHCQLYEDAARLELPVSSPTQQARLLRYLSDAYTAFLGELTPEDTALAETVKRGIQDMARLRKTALGASLKDKVETCYASAASPMCKQAEAVSALSSMQPCRVHSVCSLEKSEQDTLPIIPEAEFTNDGWQPLYLHPDKDSGQRVNQHEFRCQWERQMTPLHRMQWGRSSSQNSFETTSIPSPPRSSADEDERGEERKSSQPRGERTSDWTKVPSKLRSSMQVLLIRVPDNKASRTSRLRAS
eukprot:TRINITY_DN26663_c0_g1_i1.p1 TRINITY_DN26663_c0_g1~~TRINITY_DN26663_c0_g1_i1.p1  ORF type:complete len:272 (+),score=38.49 TRINITY_DN26663_c0_g1_i1:63-818(+)